MHYTLLSISLRILLTLHFILYIFILIKPQQGELHCFKIPELKDADERSTRSDSCDKKQLTRFAKSSAYGSTNGIPLQHSDGSMLAARPRSARNADTASGGR